MSVLISLPSLGGLVKPSIAVRGADSADLTRDLFAWLAGEPSLRGRVRIVEDDPPACALGPVAAALEAVLEPGGAATALATVVITWLRCRAGKVSLSVRGENGSPELTITAERVKSLDAPGIRGLIAQVSDALNGDLRGDELPEGDGHADA
jgi:Effector Associated Constant Component 1